MHVKEGRSLVSPSVSLKELRSLTFDVGDVHEKKRVLTFLANDSVAYQRDGTSAHKEGALHPNQGQKETQTVFDGTNDCVPETERTEKPSRAERGEQERTDETGEGGHEEQTEDIGEGEQGETEETDRESKQENREKSDAESENVNEVAVAELVDITTEENLIARQDSTSDTVLDLSVPKP